MLKEINKLVIYDESFDKEGNSKFVELFSDDNTFIDFIYMSNYIKVIIDNFNYSYLENIDYKDFNDESNLHKNVEAIFTKEYLAFLNELKIRLRLKLIVKEIIKTSDLEINNVKKSVKVNNKKTKFTPIQFKILYLLVSSPNRVFSAHEIYDRLWREPSLSERTSVPRHLSTIRHKINVNNKEYIKTIFGKGYYFDPLGNKENYDEVNNYEKVEIIVNLNGENKSLNETFKDIYGELIKNNK